MNGYLEINDEEAANNDLTVWIPASKILSIIVERADLADMIIHPTRGFALGQSRLKIEASRIRGVQEHPVTPWLESVQEAEFARRQLVGELCLAQEHQVIRWSGGRFSCTDD